MISFGESASPFIDEGDGFTRGRERVRKLLSIAAHVVEYEEIVGAHNTVNVRCMWEVPSSSSGMADVGACHTVDTWRHARGFTMFAWYGKCRRPQHCRCPEACGGSYRMGVNGAHNTVGKMSAPTTLFVSGRLQSTVSTGVQGIVTGIVV